MKIPKKLNLFGYVWKVTVDPKKDGGDFSWKNHTINVGSMYGDQEEVFLHELMEAILCHLGFRFYGQEKSMPYQFHFDHAGFVIFHQTLYQVLKENKIV